MLNELLTLAFSKLGPMVSTDISFVKNVGGQFHDQKSFGRKIWRIRLWEQPGERGFQGRGGGGSQVRPGVDQADGGGGGGGVYSRKKEQMK